MGPFLCRNVAMWRSTYGVFGFNTICGIFYMWNGCHVEFSSVEVLNEEVSSDIMT